MAVNEQSPDYCNGCDKQCEYGSKYYGCGIGYLPTLNKEKVADVNASVDAGMLLNDKYILVQKGKKNYFLLIVK